MSLFADAVKAIHKWAGPVVLLGVDIPSKMALYIDTKGNLNTCDISDLNLEADWAPAPQEGDEDVERS